MNIAIIIEYNSYIRDRRPRSITARVRTLYVQLPGYFPLREDARTGY